MDVVVSELSGKGNLLSKLETHGIQKVGDEQAREVLKDIKRLESQGFSFEAAEASVVMMYKRLDKDYQPPFSLIDFSASVEHRDRRGLFAEATVKVMVNGELIHTVAEGNGPVNSLDKALRKALVDHYPAITAFHLSDYKVRILDGKSGTSAITRVLIETQNGNRSWSTVGASANIIEASWQALVDAVEYGLSIS
jgi:2-isopropylmalate synthase